MSVNGRKKHRPAKIPFSPPEAQPQRNELPDISTNSDMVINGERVSVDSSKIVFCEPIGRGRYGEVFRARLPQYSRDIAIKQTKYIDSETTRKNTRREVENLTKCESEFLVTCYGILYHDGFILFCLELMDCSLYDLIVNAKKKLFYANAFDEKFIARTAFAITSGLNYLKEKLDVMHRDVKPQNTLISRDGNIKLCDFGISVVLNNSMAQTKIGHDMYMAPERISSNENSPYSWKADIWSLGITLVELSEGKFPYSNPTQQFDLMLQIIEKPSPSLSRTKFSDDLCDFVTDCLEKEPEKRPKYSELLTSSLNVRGANVTVEWASEFVKRILDTEVAAL